MNRRYFPLAAPARMSAQRAAAATPPAIAAAPAGAAAVPARAAALAVRDGGAGRRGGGSFGMVVVEAARRGKQLGEVHGFAAAAVEFVDLGAAAESVGEDHRARRGFPQPGQQGALGAGFAHLAVADLEAEVAGEAAAAGLQVLGLGAGRGQQLLVRVPARLVDAQNAQIWTASVVIGIEPKSAPIGGYRMRVVPS
jgi:hypothetical protein